MKIRLDISEVAPDLAQYKPFGIRLNVKGQVEFTVPDKEVVTKDPLVLTPAGLATIAGQMAEASWTQLKFTKNKLGGRQVNGN